MHAKGVSTLNSGENSGAVALFASRLLAHVGLLKFGLAAALGASGVATSNAPTQTQGYEVVDLGVIQRIAADIVPGLSASGNIVIWRQEESQAFSAVLLEGATKKPLPKPEGFRNSFAYSVNDRGNAVGWSNTTLNPVDSTSTVHATFFTRDRAVDLGTLGGLRSQAYAINNQGVIVGVSALKDNRQCAFRFADGKMTCLDPLPGEIYSVAFDINRAGVIVGGFGVASTSVKPVVHAVLWRGNKPQDLGSLSRNGNSIAYAINNHDDVVGVSDLGMEDEVLLGHAFAINDQRHIVGTLTAEERGHPRGFLWENGTVHDIDTLIPAGTYRIEAAYRINNLGQILCSGFGNGQMHALLLNPIN